MAKIILLNKPFNVLCQFSGEPNDITLANYIKDKHYYPAGRLDKDSEGLVLLTDDGQLQHKISHPRFKLEKTYWIQIEGEIDEVALSSLSKGVELKDGITLPAKVKPLTDSLVDNTIWPRVPPIRSRASIPTSWIELKISEGRNRQVRRMTARVGFPTLRLIRIGIGQWNIEKLVPGEFRYEHVHLTAQKPVKSRKTRRA